MSCCVRATGPTVVGYGLEGALKFGFYETFKVVFAGLTTNKFFNLLMASVIAGAIASIVLVSACEYCITHQVRW